MSSIVQGFTKSLFMTVLSEIGDKTFFAAAIMAMRHPRRFVLSGCLSALIVMTILSALLGWAAPNLISRKWTHHITTLLFFGFGLWSLWDAFTNDGESEEFAEVEAKLDADLKANKKSTKGSSKDADELKKQSRPFLLSLFSPIFLKAFSITFFGEWGDKSQLATIGLAAEDKQCVLLQLYSGEGAWHLRYLRKLLHSRVEFFSLSLEFNPTFQSSSKDGYDKSIRLAIVLDITSDTPRRDSL